jgi:3,4-dihydroxy 2-butanone 4-phosphate synthase / GTP cyclohydrolase II
MLSSSKSKDFMIFFAVDDHGKGIEGGLRGHALLYALGQVLKQELVFDAYEKNGFQHEYRNYQEIKEILDSLGISQMRLLTNNPERTKFFRDQGYHVKQLSIEKPYDPYLSEELGMKKAKLGHDLSLHGFSKRDIEIYGLTEDSFK